MNRKRRRKIPRITKLKIKRCKRAEGKIKVDFDDTCFDFSCLASGQTAIDDCVLGGIIMVKVGCVKRGLLLVAVIFLLNGCLPGIYITKKEPTKDGQPVEFRLGNQVEVADWVALQKQVCADLDYATETLTEEQRKDIYKYSCVEPNRHSLGETLAKLKPEQIDEICARLSQKGYVAKRDEIPTPAGELGTAVLFIGVLFCLM